VCVSVFNLHSEYIHVPYVTTKLCMAIFEVTSSASALLFLWGCHPPTGKPGDSSDADSSWAGIIVHWPGKPLGCVCVWVGVSLLHWYLKLGFDIGVSFAAL
jgi:hypothetical protein